ncbi:MAG: glycosyltransferase [Nocardioidaceae bacterium]
MPRVEMPAGRYLTCALGVRPDAGGQTLALLMRNRIFSSSGGVEPDILTFGATNDFDERRQTLLERRLLTEDIGLLNIYAHFRERDWGDRTATGKQLRDLSRYRTDEQYFADGTPWRTIYRVRDTGKTLYEYLRPDGTPYLRVPRFNVSDATTWPSQVQPISSSGEPLIAYKSLGQWFRRWIRDLTRFDDRTFVFMDSRHITPHIVPMKAPNVFLVHVLHSLHVDIPGRWDSPTSDVYARLLSLVGRMDALVTLTDRQRQDVGQRIGLRDNMFVVPNPVDLEFEPVEGLRDPNLVSTLARLDRHKRLDHAIAAFVSVVQEVPAARFQIFGAGDLGRELQKTIDRLGLTGSVTLRGHDPHARDALWRSSAFVMTSQVEGYPLATLESMSRGCPVISYDIKYGPREQITDGVDGFLVEDGDIQGIAKRVIDVLNSPGLAQRMSSAARLKAEDHGAERFLRDWSSVLRGVIRQKPQRTRLRKVHLEIIELNVQRATPRVTARFSLNRSASPALKGRSDANDTLAFSGILTVRGNRKNSGFDSARVELSAVNETSGEVTDLPLAVERTKNRFRLSATVSVSAALGAPSDATGVSRLRLRFVWRNSCWESVLRRPAKREQPTAIGV